MNEKEYPFLIEGIRKSPYRLEELLDIKRLQRIGDNQVLATGLALAILDKEENVIVAAGWQRICTQFHRVHPVTCQKCKESDAYIKNNLSQDLYVEYRCKNNMWDVAFPIVVEGEHIATFFLGQFFYEDDLPDYEHFRKQAEEFGFDTEDYLKALSEVPVVSRQRLQAMISYYGDIVQTLAETAVARREQMKSEEELERKNRELEDFAFRMSHDLKSPLNLIKGFAVAIKEDPQLFEDCFHRIIHQADYGIMFIDNLLKLAKTGKAIGSKEEIKLSPFLRKIFLSLKKSDIPMNLDMDENLPSVVGDPDSLMQVFSNLMENSIKYRNPDKEPLIIQVGYETVDGYITISIKDNGQGIDRKYIERIFEPGFRADKKQGTGFGLAIVRKIIEAHHGKVWVQSRGKNQGTEFYIQLPAFKE